MKTDSETPAASHSRLLFVDDESIVLQGLRRSLHLMRGEWDMTFVESERALEGPFVVPWDMNPAIGNTI